MINIIYNIEIYSTDWIIRFELSIQMYKYHEKFKIIQVHIM